VPVGAAALGSEGPQGQTLANQKLDAATIGERMPLAIVVKYSSALRKAIVGMLQGGERSRWKQIHQKNAWVLAPTPEKYELTTTVSAWSAFVCCECTTSGLG
jgi:hypothetical protein